MNKFNFNFSRKFDFLLSKYRNDKTRVKQAEWSVTVALYAIHSLLSARAYIISVKTRFRMVQIVHNNKYTIQLVV